MPVNNHTPYVSKGALVSEHCDGTPEAHAPDHKARRRFAHARAMDISTAAGPEGCFDHVTRGSVEAAPAQR